MEVERCCACVNVELRLSHTNTCPRIVAVSDDALQLLGIELSDENREDFLNIFSGNKYVTDSISTTLLFELGLP